MQDRLILEPEAGGEDDAAFDPPAHLPDAVGQALDPREPLVERLGLLARGVAAKRQRIAEAPLIIVLDARDATPSRSRACSGSVISAVSKPERSRNWARSGIR